MKSHVEKTERGPVWTFGPFTLDVSGADLSRDGTPVPIEPQSLRLLTYLVRNRDRVVSRAQIVEALWEGRAVTDWAIAGAVKALRRTLGDTARDKVYIQTVHSRGFRFIAPTTGPDTAPTNVARVEDHVVLVRPFRAAGSEQADSYLAEGLTEDLITDLSQSNTLAVLSSNASRAIGDDFPPDDLKVTRIVGGSLRRIADTIRINVSITGADGHHQLWSERFDLVRDSLLSGQDRISERVLDTLCPGTARPGIGAARTRNADAYDHYLKGRFAYFRYDPMGFKDALAHFETAAALDPGYADALAQQAYCRTTLHVFGLPGSDTTLDPAEALARQAISIDGSSALGHARLGWTLGYRARRDDAVAAFQAGLARAPDNAEISLAFGETMNRLAEPEAAQPLLDAAFRRETYFPPSWEFARGHTRILLGDHDPAISHFTAVLNRVDRFIPARVQLARALVETGDLPAARAEIDHIRERAPKYSLAHAGRMFPYPVAHERDRLIDALSAAGMAA